MCPDDSLPDTSAAQPTDTVLAALVRHIATVAAASGLPGEQLLGEAGISPALLADANSRIPALLLERLIRAGVAISGDEQLGLRMSRRADPAGFGVLGYIRQACATLGEVIDMTIRYERLVSDIGTTSLRHRPGVALWCWDCKTDDPVVHRQATEYLLGCWISIQMRLIRQQPPPILAVHLRHGPPADRSRLADYEAVFGCPVYFDQEESGLVLPTHVLSLPLSHPDSALQQTLEQHARQLLSQRREESSAVEPVRARLRLLLHQGVASRERLAENLGISSRHLHRQLEKAGTSYRELLDEIRLEMAQGFLQDASFTVEAVGLRLHFSESQSFIRWFRGMTGVTPAEYRRRQGD